jgi:hypothetical protein
MEALLAFAAALLAFRLAGLLAVRWRRRRAPELLAWSASLASFALAAAALAWGSAAGWTEAAFRLYYLFGGLLTAPLLGAGSLLLTRRRWVTPIILVYVGLAVGAAVAEPLTSSVSGDVIPEAQEHLDYFPLRLLAIVGNVAGTAAVVGVGLASIRRRPLAMSLILAGVAVAAIGSAVAGLGVAQTAAFFALSSVFLYAGFTISSGNRQTSLPG